MASMAQKDSCSGMCKAGISGDTVEISQLQYTVAEVPVVQVEQVHFPVVTQRPILMVQPLWRTIEISQLQYAPVGRCPCCGGRVGFLVPSLR